MESLLRLIEKNENGDFNQEIIIALCNRVINLEERIKVLDQYYDNIGQGLDENLPKCFGTYSDYFCKELNCKVKKECITTNAFGGL